MIWNMTADSKPVRHCMVKGIRSHLNENAPYTEADSWLTMSLCWSVRAVPARQGGTSTIGGPYKSSDRPIHWQPWLICPSRISAPGGYGIVSPAANLPDAIRVPSVPEPLTGSGIAESYVFLGRKPNSVKNAQVGGWARNSHSQVKQVSPMRSLGRQGSGSGAMP